jgi:hypothetical protein
MPRVEFNALPSSARVWVFGAAAPVTGAARDTLLDAIDAHLLGWKAHGAPLVCARDWRDDRFLAVAVDEAATGASGCSIDGLYRVLDTLESSIGTSLLDASAVFWRGEDGQLRSGTRAEFRAAAAAGQVVAETPVFDTTVDNVGAWTETFERPAAQSWHARLLSR